MTVLFAFLRERFSLASHLPMVGVFALANVVVVAAAANGATFSGSRFALVWLLATLYFFRLRAFDEIKDLDFDLAHNPERPLARGLVTAPQLRRWITVALLCECAIAVVLAGAFGLAVHGVAQLYSWLMFREFFVGKWLRPHLTTYAVTHTFSAVLLGASAGCLYAGSARLDGRMALMLLFNWCLFNLFEFGRKTWAPAEERAEVESYSLNFGLVGAVGLALSQIGLGLGLIALHPHARCDAWLCLVQPTLAAAVCAAGAVLVVRQTPRSAAQFRAVISAYLVLFYGALVAEHARRAFPPRSSHVGAAELDSCLCAA